jgi:hypothetical protein
VAPHSRAWCAQGPALLLARSEGGSRFGAFNPLGFASREDYRDTNGAFLFRWPPGGAADDEPEYLPKARALLLLRRCTHPTHAWHGQLLCVCVEALRPRSAASLSRLAWA